MLAHFSKAMQGKIEFPGGLPNKNLARIQSAISVPRRLVLHALTAVEREWNRLAHYEVMTEKERKDSWLSRASPG